MPPPAHARAGARAAPAQGEAPTLQIKACGACTSSETDFVTDRNAHWIEVRQCHAATASVGYVANRMACMPQVLHSRPGQQHAVATGSVLRCPCPCHPIHLYTSLFCPSFRSTLLQLLAIPPTYTPTQHMHARTTPYPHSHPTPAARRCWTWAACTCGQAPWRVQQPRRSSTWCPTPG